MKLRGQKTHGLKYKDRRPKNHGQFLLHGHTHSKEIVKGRMIHVGVYAHGFTPVSLNKIAQIITDIKEAEKKGIKYSELIPTRNDFEVLKRFVDFFQKKNFVITFGTEHNSPALTPLRVDTRGDVPFDYELRKIAYEGACVIASHQYLRSTGEEGFVNASGIPKLDQKDQFIELGAAVIDRFLQR